MKTFTNTVNLAIALAISALIAAPVNAKNVHSMWDKSARGHSRTSFDFKDIPKSRWPGKESYNEFRGRHSLFGEFNSDDKSHWVSRFQAFDLSKIGSGRINLDEYLSDWEQEHGLNIWGKHVLGGHGSFDKEVLSDYITVEKVTNPGTSVVPIPPSAWLMVSALGVLGWRGRKSAANKQSA